MSSILQKAQQEEAKELHQMILDKLDGLPEGTPIYRDALKEILDEVIKSVEKPLTEERQAAKTAAWDFSVQKSLPVFARDDGLLIRPIQPTDEEFYRSVRLQYSLIYRSAYYTAEGKKEDLFQSEALASNVFYCIIEDAEHSLPIGYIGIKDTRTNLWEIAIELDGKSLHQGFGSRSIPLYLNEIHRITGKAEFQARVETDNIPSQRCFEKIGANLVGLCDSVVLKTEAEKLRFEERHLDLIDTHMTGLANRLGIEPRKLLSHVLDYRLTCPL